MTPQEPLPPGEHYDDAPPILKEIQDDLAARLREELPGPLDTPEETKAKLMKRSKKGKYRGENINAKWLDEKPVGERLAEIERRLTEMLQALVAIIVLTAIALAFIVKL